MYTVIFVEKNVRILSKEKDSRIFSTKNNRVFAFEVDTESSEIFVCLLFCEFSISELLASLSIRERVLVQSIKLFVTLYLRELFFFARQQVCEY